ncbi:hypothetical protein O9993_05620 [Vibrio lentus]|nr:hypothetical protein [Vibrio lentus]
MAAGTLPFSTVFSSVVFFQSRLYHWRVVAARHGNGDGLRLAHACVVVGRGVADMRSRLYARDPVIIVAAWVNV